MNSACWPWRDWATRPMSWAIWSRQRCSSVRLAIWGVPWSCPPRELVRRVYRWLVRTLIWQFKREEAISLGEEGLRLLGDDTSLEAAQMTGMIGSAQYFQGHTTRGREALLRCAAVVQQLPYAPDLRVLWWWMGFATIEARGPVAALQLVEGFRALLQQHPDDLASQGTIESITADILGFSGDLRAALTYKQRALALFRRSGASEELSCLAQTGWILLAMGTSRASRTAWGDCTICKSGARSGMAWGFFARCAGWWRSVVVHCPRRRAG